MALQRRSPPIFPIPVRLPIPESPRDPCPLALRARSLVGGRTDSHHRTSPLASTLRLTSTFLPLPSDGASTRPPIVAAEIIENLEAALEQFRDVATALGADVASEAAL